GYQCRRAWTQGVRPARLRRRGRQHWRRQSLSHRRVSLERRSRMTLTLARSLAKRARVLAGSLAFAVAGLAVQPAFAQDGTEPVSPPAAPPIGIELNRLLNNVESGACTGTFVVYNRRAEPLAQLTIEVILWDRGGIIVERLALGFT